MPAELVVDMAASLGLRYLGGPTAVLDLGGLRLLTDPTFDPPGSYPIGQRMLTKTIAGTVRPEELGQVDAVLLSHDQHPDNLDHAGRDFLASAVLTLSTSAARERLGGTVRALATWSHIDLATPDGGALRVTAVPARHGPPGCEQFTGEVTGFVLSGDGLPTVYVSGDNAALEYVHAVAGRYPSVDIAVIFAGAARTALLDGANLTLTSAQAAEAAAVLDATHVVPLHFEGWSHFSQGRDTLIEAFAAAGLSDRLHLLELGQQITMTAAHDVRASTDSGWVPQACTLPTAEQPVRLAEFDDLFAASLVAADRVTHQRLRLTLAGGHPVADAVRDLTAKESECCSFFSFEVVEDGDLVLLDIAVPDAQVAVLDALAARASSART